MEEDIKNLEELKKEYIINGSVSISILSGAKYINSINNILSILKQLEEERNTYRRQLNDVFSRGFIHKDKIKEQIEWLDNDIKNTKRKIAEEQIYYDDIRKVRLKAYCTKSNEIKNRLKELLGEENK